MQALQGIHNTTDYNTIDNSACGN